METLKQGREIDVTIDETGITEKVLVRQLPVKDYPKAIQATDNEMKLVAVICAKPQEWVGSLTPESYEAVVVAMNEVNEKGFFSYASREHDKLMKKLSGVSPELLKVAAEKALSVSAPGLRPRAA